MKHIYLCLSDFTADFSISIQLKIRFIRVIHQCDVISPLFCAGLPPKDSLYDE
jgi:hypothetical protein